MGDKLQRTTRLLCGTNIIRINPLNLALPLCTVPQLN